MAHDPSLRRRFRWALAASLGVHGILLATWPAPMRPGVADASARLLVSALPSPASAGEGTAPPKAMPAPPPPAAATPAAVPSKPRPTASAGDWVVAGTPAPLPMVPQVSSAPPATTPAPSAVAATPSPSGGEAVASSAATAGAGVSAAEGSSGAVSAEGLRQYRVALSVQTRRFKRYPAVARDRGWQGTVEIEVSGGGPVAVPLVRLANSSGYPLLDQNALDWVGRAVHSAALPEALRKSSFRLVLPVEFRLDE